MKRKIFYSIILILFLICVYLIYTNYFSKASVSNIEKDERPISYVYLWSDQDFNNADKKLIEGDYQSAKDLYNKLLQEDLSKVDVITRSQLSLRLATLEDIMGNKQAAVFALNKIATSENEYFITRAFAYQYMAQMIYETRDPEVLKIITGATGVSSTASDKYSDVSLQLLKKSNDIAPLYLALTESMKVELQSYDGKYTPEVTDKIRYDLGTIDRMIKDIEAEPNKGYMLPLALLRKAQVAERIDASGHYGLPKSVEEYYKDAIGAYDQYPEARSYNYVYYEYARYLANKFGDSRKTDIESLLVHYQSDVKEKQNLRTLLSNIEKTGQSKRQSDELKTLKKVSTFNL